MTTLQLATTQTQLQWEIFMTNSLITTEELGQHLKMSPVTLRNWARAGVIPSLMLSRKARRFLLSDVMKALKDPGHQRKIEASFATKRIAK
jgi:excisionase family DNA binding protein